MRDVTFGKAFVLIPFSLASGQTLFERKILSNFTNISFRTKVVLLGIISVLATAVALLAGVAVETQRYSQDVQHNVEAITTANLENILQGVYNLIEVQGKTLQQQVDNNLRVADYVLNQHGQVKLSGETVQWKATNQLTQATVDIQLPKMIVGEVWLGQNSDLNSETPVIDEVVHLVSGTATLFQRMNAAGDMLRVATNVENLNGKRAIGTYIAATNPNGVPNVVVSTVLKGETYHGVAFVVNAWYVTAYQPVRDATGEIVGMLYVGIKQESDDALRQAIQEARVGLTGHIYVLSGSGDKRGVYIMSPENASDGKSALTVKDVDGQSPVEIILSEATSLGTDEVKVVRYLEPAQGMAAPRWKDNYISYFKLWDWVIVAEVYEDELQQYQTALNTGRENMLLVISLIALGIALLVGAASFLLMGSIVRPLLDLTNITGQIAEGNMDLEAQVHGSDEIARLAQSFNRMTIRLRNLLLNEKHQVQRLQGAVNRYVEHMRRVAAGDLTDRVVIEENLSGNNDPLIELGQQLNDMTASLQGMIQQIRGAIVDLNSATAEILASTAQQATSTHQQSASVAQTTTSMDEVRTITEQNSTRSQEVANASRRAVDVSRMGKQSLQETINSMGQIKTRVQHISESLIGLSNQAQQISEIIATVNEIAAQSNMLALNASVEAARAGEHGQGFSVVAVEVRRLAEQSRKATTQIKGILSSTQQAIDSTVIATEEGVQGVEHGMQLAAQSGESIEKLTIAIDQSAQIAMQVMAGGQQQRTGIEQIVEAMHQINQATSHSLISMRQAESSAQNLNSLARKLADTVAIYRA